MFIKKIKKYIIGFLIGTLLLSFHVDTAGAENNNAPDSIFNKDEVGTVNIEIDEADFQDILDNAMEEEYHQATITYNGQEIGYTGVRAKGNSSLMSVAGSDSDRYSFKLKFDEYVDQNFEGYTKINLNNNFSDPSYMREFLTYEVLEEMGLPTPQYSYVNLSVNGEPYGLYLAVENIEEPYLERQFGSSTGNLFKAETGSNLQWEDGMSIEDTNLEQKVGMETNTNLLKMIEALNTGENVEEYLDVDSYLRYLAVSTVMGNMDSYQGMMSHNYYLYEQDGKFTFLAWDHNMSIGGMGDNQEQIEMLLDEPTMGSVDDKPLTKYVLENEDYKETYHGYVEEVADILEGMEERVGELKDLFGESVEQDPTAFYTYDEFLANTGDEEVDAYAGIVSFMEERLDHVHKQLNGEIDTYENGEGMSMAMGEGGMFDMGDGEMPEGGMPGMEDGEMPEGGMPNMGDMEMPEGGMPGMGNQGAGGNTQGQVKELISVLILIVLLAGTLMFINRFKRHRA